MVGGGLRAIVYSLKASHKVGWIKMLKALFSKNTCKTCALGMGGQRGGLTTENGAFPEVCKKAFQAQLTDIQPPISNSLFKTLSIEDFKKISISEITKIGRLNHPLHKKSGDTHFSLISWDDAIDMISNKFKNTQPVRTFFYCSGRSSNETGFLLQLFARYYGSNNINNTSNYCHQASGVGMNSTLGTNTATIDLNDLSKCELIFVIGANPASNHPRFVRHLMNCRRKGGNVIVINPAKEKGLVKFAVPSDIISLISGGSPIASEYIQLKSGGDIALLKGIAKEIIEQQRYDIDFINAHTYGFEKYFEDISKTTWDEIISNSGIDRTTINKIANIYSNSKNAVFSWSMGIAHHLNGVENVESIVNLALLRGMIGKKYSGLLPLRGHSNIQGLGSVGVTPVLDKVILSKIENEFDIKLSDTDGLDTIECLIAAKEKRIDIAFIVGGNLLQSSPDTKFVTEALNNIPFKVFLTTNINIGHLNGISEEVVILPVTARDEEKSSTTQESMFNYVRLSDGGIIRLDNVRSETEIISDIAQHICNNVPINFAKMKDHNYIRYLISKTITGYDKLNNITNNKEEFQIPGRTFHKPEFNFPDKKAKFAICSIPKNEKESDEFYLMTVRSEGQFNTIIYEEQDIYRLQKNRNVVLINKNDIAKMGLKENDSVNLESATGILKNLKVREFDVSEGSIISYFPEANVLIPIATDSRSNTPAFKSIKVKISKV